MEIGILIVNLGSYDVEYWYGKFDDKDLWNEESDDEESDNEPSNDEELDYENLSAGKLNEINFSDEALVKNIIKYNGYDYLVKSINGQYSYGEEGYTKTTITPYYEPGKYEAEQTAEGITQIMLAVDCSYSMRHETMIVDGNQVSKLEVAVNSAKKLINQLLDENNNIYIGLIFFSGANYRAVSLTKNKNELELALNDIITNQWYTANTDVSSALDKGANSFFSEDNRYIILVSDGFPTKYSDADYEIETYCDDSDEETESKLYTIRDLTKKKIKDLLSQDIKLITLLTIPENDTEERDFVKGIYEEGFEGNEDLIFKLITDKSEEFEDTIKYDIKYYIEEESQYYQKEGIAFIPAIGYEDYERYKEIIENFQSYDLINTSQFCLIENYKSINEEQVKDFSEKTYGHAYGGHYTINEPVTAPSEDKTYDDDGNLTSVTTYVVNHTGYVENVALAKRPAFSLDFDIDITGLEINLTNGVTYINKQKEELTNEVIAATLEEDLAYGSEVLVTYSLQLKNETKMPYSDLQVICYLPKNINIRIDRFGGYEAKKISIKDYYEQGLIGEEPYQKYKNTKQAVLLTFHYDTTEDLKKTVNTYEFKIKGSVRIKEIDDLENITCIGEILSYSNYMEYIDTQEQELTYTNSENSRYVLLDDDIRNNNNIDEKNIIPMSRRMTAKTYAEDELTENYSSVRPGNDIQTTAEIDFDESSEIPVIPPTGLTKKMIRKNKILKYSLLTLIILAMLIIILLKKFKK